MKAHADSKKENKNQAVANSVAQKTSSSRSTSQFMNNHPEATAQGKLQAMVEKSPRVLQLRPFQAMANNHLYNSFDEHHSLQLKRLSIAPPNRFDIVQRSDIFDGVDDMGYEEEHNVDADEFEIVSVKAISPDGVPALEGPSDAWGVDKDFSDLGLDDKLDSIALQRPRSGGTHYEVHAVVGGVNVKLDLTKGGYRMIYNAGEADSEYFHDSVPVPVEGKTGRDLYESFLALTKQLGKYHSARNDCQNFAEALVDEITAEVAAESDDDSFM